MNESFFAGVTRLFVTGALAAGALLLTAPNAVSQETLADLASGGSITNGDKVFSNFSNISQVGDLSVPLSSIYVEPIDVGGDLGIRFESALWSLSGADQNYDLSFNFQVSTTSGQALIEDDTLAMTGGINADGATDIAEGVTDTNANTLASNYVYLNSDGQQLTDNESLTNSPYAVINISKDFAMTTGADPSSQVFMSHFDQTFSQVPEPSIALLFGLGGLGMLVFRRRK
jgi:hypothetical protein